MDKFELSLEVRSMFSELRIMFWQAYGYRSIQDRILLLMDKVIELYPYTVDSDTDSSRPAQNSSIITVV